MHVVQLTQCITVTQLPTLLDLLTNTDNTRVLISNCNYHVTINSVFPTVGYDLYAQIVVFNQSLNELNVMLSKIDEIRGTIQLAYNVTGNSDYTLFSNGYNTNSLQWHNIELTQFNVKIEKLKQSINDFLSEVS